ncbi:anhydro-N-acetylmuramic acid kinase [Pasteurellaceae bacterium RH1A]|nr:anhydro-N-acetylmuramic acid kinase [Pasteurellaceae bacterium RH1A]
MQPQYYLGVMSGTSLDGVDLALVDFTKNPPRLTACNFTPMPENLRVAIQACLTGQVSLQALGELDHQLGQLYGQCIERFLAQEQIAPEAIQAIGCHGQTIWHSPQGEYPFTMQIGDMNLVAALTGITVVGDLRRKDMAFGGQGAPLVPAFHQAVFFDENLASVVLNIGGISNISLLIPGQPVVGYDTGVGNALLDSWIEEHLGQRFDKNGDWAKTGKVNAALLADLLDEPFFAQAPPKSTGRELFNLPWLAKKLANQPACQPQDVQATLVEFTVQSIVNELAKIKTRLPCRLLVCGGGAKNALIMERLVASLPDWQVMPTTELGLDVDYVEAAAFAWLAYQRMHNLPANLPSVTGARQAVCLGAIYPRE